MRILLLFLLLFASCASHQTGLDIKEIERSAAIVGNGAKELQGYYFQERKPASVYVHFVEPFLAPPNVTATNPSLDYNISETSEWGFYITLKGQGFWKDASFAVQGEFAQGASFCRETDSVNDSFFGGIVYNNRGIFPDECSKDEEYKILKETSCENLGLREEFIECEYNCYDQRGPAFCVNDKNVKAPCDDQFPQKDFFKKNFVSFNGRRFYDFCINQIHGTKKELSEFYCDGTALKELNQFCVYGCSDGRCLTQEEAIETELLSVVFFAYTNTTQVDDWVAFQAQANDPQGLLSLHLKEFAHGSTEELTWEPCSGTMCNATWRVRRTDSGLRTFIVQAMNAKNYSLTKNLTLNFSGDIDGPSLNLSLRPTINELFNFTYVNATANDKKGIEYLALYRQASDSEWELLQSKDCKQETSCSFSLRFNSTKEGDIQYILKSLDTNKNAAFAFSWAKYLGKTPEMTCERYSELNAPCIYGCLNGHCLTKDEALEPALLFFAYTNSTTIDEWVRFSALATDIQGIESLTFKEIASNGTTELTTEICSTSTCNATWKVARTDSGIRTFSVVSKNAKDLLREKNLTLNFSGDPYGPELILNMTPHPNEAMNFTYVNASSKDEKGVEYLALYEQRDESRWVLMQTEDCEKKTSCPMDFRFNRTTSGKVSYALKSTDVNGNLAFAFTTIEFLPKNLTWDTTPPSVNFSTEQERVYAGDDVIFQYLVSDQAIKSINFYKMEGMKKPLFISSFGCDEQECEDEFAYKNLLSGVITYILNVTDFSGNYKEDSIILEYLPLDDNVSLESEAPKVVLRLVNVEEGLSNYTQIEYSATDESTLTYLNLYEKEGDEYRLLRTKFCFRETSCSSFFRRERLKKSSIFLAVAVDLNGNRGQLEEEYLPN